MPFESVFPRFAAVGAHRDAAVVAGINPAGGIDHHGVMIAVDEVLGKAAAAGAAPLAGGHAVPARSAILGKVQIDRSADDEIGISGMHGDELL